MDIIEILSKVDTDKSVIPENCLSFSEMNDYIVENSMRQYNEMIKVIGSEELAIFESTGSIVLYEGEKAQNLKNRLSDKYIKNWSVRKDFYDKVMEYSKDEKENVRKMGNLSKYNTGSLEDSRSYGKTHKFTDLGKIDFAANMNSFIDETIKVANSIFNSENISDRKKATEMLEASICSKISGINGVKTIKEMKKALKEKYMGELIVADGKWIKSNWNNISNTLKDCSFSIIKKSYNEEKKAIAANIKKIDKLNGMEDHSVVIGSLVGLAFSTMQTCYSVIFDICKRQSKEYSNIALKVYKISKKSMITKEAVEEVEDKKVEDTQEETTDNNVEESTTDTNHNSMVNEAFNF